MRVTAKGTVRLSLLASLQDQVTPRPVHRTQGHPRQRSPGQGRGGSQRGKNSDAGRTPLDLHQVWGDSLGNREVKTPPGVTQQLMAELRSSSDTET